jgi:hypothetical protein
MRNHALLDVLEVEEVVLGGNLVRILHQKSKMAVSFRTDGVAMVVVGQFDIGGSVGWNEEPSLAEASWDMMGGCSRIEGICCLGGGTLEGEKE